MLTILLRLTFALLGANTALIAISLVTGIDLDTTVHLYVYLKQGDARNFIVQEPHRAIRLDFDAPACREPFLPEADEQNFESLTDFYAWSATRSYTLPAAEALAILQCRWHPEPS